MKHYSKCEPKLTIYFSAENMKYAKGCYLIKKTVREAVLATLRYEQFEANTELSVTFCGNDYICEINREFRDKPMPTDVLSFPMYTCEEILEGLPEMEEEAAMLGDIVLSLERAAEQARELGHSFLHEVAFLTVHSTLHLLGYDHEISTEHEEMQCAAQREIMSTLLIADEALSF